MKNRKKQGWFDSWEYSFFANILKGTAFPPKRLIDHLRQLTRTDLRRKGRGHKNEAWANDSSLSRFNTLTEGYFTFRFTCFLFPRAVSTP